VPLDAERSETVKPPQRQQTERYERCTDRGKPDRKGA
jgi:hypothetical protein